MPSPSALDHRPLTPVEERVLAFERHSWASSAGKEEAIRAQFGMSPTRYYLLLSGLVESPEAIARDPLLVQRLRRRLRTGAV